MMQHDVGKPVLCSVVQVFAMAELFCSSPGCNLELIASTAVKAALCMTFAAILLGGVCFLMQLLYTADVLEPSGQLYLTGERWSSVHAMPYRRLQVLQHLFAAVLQTVNLQQLFAAIVE
jgi:hypothetical protein